MYIYTTAFATTTTQLCKYNILVVLQSLNYQTAI